MKHLTPYHWLEESDIEDRIDLIDLFVKTGLCKSKSEARRLILQEGLSFSCGLTSDNRYAMMLYRGKKKVAMVFGWEPFMNKEIYVSFPKEEGYGITLDKGE